MKTDYNEITKYLNPNKDKTFLRLSILFFFIWLLFKYPIRKLVLVSDIGINTFLSFAPNLFAAITLVFWQTYITASKPWLTLLSVIIVLFSAEFIQLFMTTQKADVYDLFATVLGSLLAIGFVFLNKTRKLNHS